VLQREGVRLSGDSSFVIMDIIVRLSDMSYMNVEIQKVGYAFPGERTSCYASDLILRQYDKLKADMGNQFSYYSMCPVRIIVIMEESNDTFKKVSPHYMHRRMVSYDSGAKVAELSDIVYVSLDTFQKTVQNNIDNMLHAWLTLLSARDFDTAMKLIIKYPDFLDIYEEIALYRTKPEVLINMYSDVLAQMDHNLEVYMNDQLRQKNAELEAVIDKMGSSLAEKDATISENKASLAEKDSEIAALKAQIAELTK
jgi:hypothetical protein